MKNKRQGMNVLKGISLITLLCITQFSSAQILPGKSYVFINKSSKKVLGVKDAATTAGASVRQENFNESESQKFTFVNNNTIYQIKTKSNLTLSLKYQPVAAVAHAAPGLGGSRILVQDKLYTNSINCSMSAIANCPDDQKWKLVDIGNNTYFIESVAFPNKVLQPLNDDNGAGLILAEKSNSDMQEWIIDTLRRHPNQGEAELGYGPLNIDLGDNTPFYIRDNWVDIDAGDVHVEDAKADINQICPQHRSVGETEVRSLPKESYEILEGVVIKKGAEVASSDFPTSHYTNDICFDVKPDPQYFFLMGATYTLRYPNTAAGRNCVELEQQLRVAQHNLSIAAVPKKGFYRDQIKRIREELLSCQNTKVIVENDYQKEIEVEWESGLGQDGSNDNPAVIENRKGNSFGFSTEGHTKGDVIWNWPTVDDRVHVEGIWIWDRGHNAPTEIHPPHFLAVQRKLPVSFTLGSDDIPVINNEPTDKFMGTRVDVFASAQGSLMWNNKGLESYSQTVNMKRKDYSFTIKQPFSPPSVGHMHHSVLRCKYIKQKADNFPAEPIMVVVGNRVEVTIPWKTASVSNDAIFARSFVVYWEDLSEMVGGATSKVLDTEKPKLYHVEIIKVNLLTKMDGDGDGDDGIGNHNYGDFRIFCNVGSNWIMLNEFDSAAMNTDNIFRHGLGKALGKSTFQTYKSFNVYVANKASAGFRISACGWEADAVNAMLMGRVLNEYSRDGEPLNKLFGENVTALDDGGRADDGIGKIDQMFSPVSMGTLNTRATLRGFDGDGRHIFNIVYKISEIPYLATNPATAGELLPETH